MKKASHLRPLQTNQSPSLYQCAITSSLNQCVAGVKMCSKVRDCRFRKIFIGVKWT